MFLRVEFIWGQVKISRVKSPMGMEEITQGGLQVPNVPWLPPTPQVGHQKGGFLTGPMQDQLGEEVLKKKKRESWGTCEARKFTGPAGSDRNYYLLSRLVYFTYLGDLPPT